MRLSVNAFIAAGTLCSFAWAGSALAATTANNWYLGAGGDVTWLKHSDIGVGGNLALGYHSNDMRLEAEGGYHGAGGDGGYSGVHYFTYMGNAYYDFNGAFDKMQSGWQAVPYIGAGLGGASIHRGNGGISNTFDNHNNSFAYQGMLGLSLASSTMPSTVWSLGYRYLGTSHYNVHANNIGLGVRFNF